MAPQGRRPGGRGAARTTRRSALGAGRRPQAKRAGGMVAPPWGAIYARSAERFCVAKSSEYTTCSGPPEAARHDERTSPLGNFLE